jgi:methionyl-tRNA formyltransferase
MICLCGKGNLLVECYNYLNSLNSEVKLVFQPDENKNNYFKCKVINENINKNSNYIIENNINIIFSLQYPFIIKNNIIKLVDKIVNFHYAPLPQLRGMYPISHAILSNMRQFGVTAHYILDEGIDTGDIIKSKCWDLNGNETAYDIYRTCEEKSIELFISVYNEYINNNLGHVEQNNYISTYYPTDSIDFSDLEINTNKYFKYVDCFIRSRIFPGKNVPYIFINNVKYYIYKSECTSLKKQASPIIFADGGIYCQCKQGVLFFEIYNTNLI